VTAAAALAFPIPPRRIGPIRTLRHSMTLTWRGLMRIKHSPGQIWDLVITPIIMVTVFVFLFGGAIGGGDRRGYLQFMLPGVMVQTVVFASLGTGTALHTDITNGIFDRFRSLPIARSAPLIGAIFGDLFRYVVSVVVVLLFGMALGFRIHTDPLRTLAAVGLVMAFATALCWVTALFGLIAKSAQSLSGMGFLLMFPLTFGSNVFVPTNTLPGWMQSWVKLNPVTALTDAVRALLSGGPLLRPLWYASAWTVAILVVFAPLAVRAYRNKT
jgi:oleandomycin transport system permease protein